MEKDVVQIRCLTDNERYADLINGIVFGGRQVVQRDDLREMDSQTDFIPALRWWCFTEKIGMGAGICMEFWTLRISHRNWGGYK